MKYQFSSVPKLQIFPLLNRVNFTLAYNMHPRNVQNTRALNLFLLLTQYIPSISTLSTTRHSVMRVIYAYMYRVCQSSSYPNKAHLVSPPWEARSAYMRTTRHQICLFMFRLTHAMSNDDNFNASLHKVHPPLTPHIIFPNMNKFVRRYIQIYPQSDSHI